ncbi:hypothetical protein VTN02DRAFT_3598 [Thermoascus thermophilus]
MKYKAKLLGRMLSLYYHLLRRMAVIVPEEKKEKKKRAVIPNITESTRAWLLAPLFPAVRLSPPICT